MYYPCPCVGILELFRTLSRTNLLIIILFVAPPGFNFLKNLQTGTTKLLVQTKARGQAPFLAQRARFTSKMDCTVTYYWDSRETDRTCKEKHSLEV